MNEMVAQVSRGAGLLSCSGLRVLQGSPMGHEHSMAKGLCGCNGR